MQRADDVGREPAERHVEEPWASLLAHNEFTHTLGPDDYTIEVCGRGRYCARHDLAPGRCCTSLSFLRSLFLGKYSRRLLIDTFPRGHSGHRMANYVSAATSPGNCCVLFSRLECHGLAQVVKGNISDLKRVGFSGLPHSVVCNVNEFCNPAVQDKPPQDAQIACTLCRSY